MTSLFLAVSGLRKDCCNVCQDARRLLDVCKRCGPADQSLWVQAFRVAKWMAAIFNVCVRVFNLQASKDASFRKNRGQWLKGWKDEEGFRWLTRFCNSWTQRNVGYFLQCGSFLTPNWRPMDSQQVLRNKTIPGNGCIPTSGYQFPIIQVFWDSIISSLKFLMFSKSDLQRSQWLDASTLLFCCMIPLQVPGLVVSDITREWKWSPWRDPRSSAAHWGAEWWGNTLFLNLFYYALLIGITS